jgi:cytochrome c peroxidase
MFRRWVWVLRRSLVSKGRLTPDVSSAVPSGLGRFPKPSPKAEALGYFQFSLREKRSAVSCVRGTPHKGIALLLALTGLCLLSCANAAQLDLEITPVFSGEPLQLNSLRYQTAAAETFSVTRLSYLLSGFALERPDGSWLEFSNQVAWLDVEKGRSTIELSNVPPQTFRGMRFEVGLSPELNHAKPEQFGPDHPLNPNLNGLHWGWQGGYVFMAVEGMWRKTAGPYDGWSFHLARDTNRTSVSLPLSLDLRNDVKVEVVFDLGALMSAPRPISFAKDGSSTHSREMPAAGEDSRPTRDPVASALVRNLPGAFQVRGIEMFAAREDSRPTGDAVAARAQPLYMPPHFTPYPFEVSAGFPIPDLPRDNPLIKERVELGKRLFHDPILSRDDSISCASCHQTDHAFADARRFSLGVAGLPGARNAMPLFNLAWKSSFFWDGRAPSVRAQALMPIQDHSEMDELLTNVCVKLRGGIALVSKAPSDGERDRVRGDATPGMCTDYPALFNAAFGSPGITGEKIGLALEQFVLTLVSFDSKFDRAMKGEIQLSEQEQHGFELFMTENDPRRNQFGADCFHCHGGPLFQSQTFANNGLDDSVTDAGREKITGKPADRGKFATPTLRNVALTAPYMHDGRFNTLEEVIEHYSTGMKRSPTLDPNLAKHPVEGMRLSKEDKSALVAFLKTLTDEHFVSKPSEKAKNVASD